MKYDIGLILFLLTTLINMLGLAYTAWLDANNYTTLTQTIRENSMLAFIVLLFELLNTISLMYHIYF